MIHAVLLQVIIAIIITTLVYLSFFKNVDDAYSSLCNFLGIGRIRVDNGQLIMKRRKNEQHQYVVDDLNEKYIF